ncbi:YgfZ/GcvT domain-containing protein [Pseudoalteromonas sp. SSDWG2]|uniref:CAF17-like 4Fe-4S cluster assembly/insertion protein YgfZ n=1 Tax=Pseudoalteromonas sp. SSDWG2 TaxID=3139391 RepID=UPI003BA86CEA
MSALSVHATDQTAIYVQGEDAKSYLQGQLTQDLNDVTASKWLWAGHCSAKGKLWACFRVCEYQNGYALFCSKAEAHIALAELKKYAVFSKVEISATNAPVLGLIATQEQLASELNITVEHPVTVHGEALILQLDVNRYLVAGPCALSAQSDSTQQFSTLQIKAGEPSLNAAAINEYVPQMVNLQALGGISFTKGCYTGQETVARMKYLGKNKRAMFIVKAAHSELLSETAQNEEQMLDLERQVGQNWRRAGSLISQACHDGELVGLAVLPNDTELDTQLRAKHAPEVVFTLEPLPYSINAE